MNSIGSNRMVLILDPIIFRTEIKFRFQLFFESKHSQGQILICDGNQ